MTRTYFDYNATSPPSATVAEQMSVALTTVWGNPSSVHHFGQMAKAAVDVARAQVAALISAQPTEVVFLSGGTEANNFAIRGAAHALLPAGRRHLIVSAIEHEAVLQTVTSLAKLGWEVTLLEVDTTGVLDPERLQSALTDRTALVSVMHANNEIGTVQPIAALAHAAHERGALFHTDAVQSAGKIPVSVATLGVDLLSLSAHKFSGPKGVGALWIRRGLRLQPQLTGGKQERSRRAGTENIVGIVGMGAAATEASANMDVLTEKLSTLRDRLETGVLSSVPGTALNGARSPRVPNTTNISFDRVEAESLLIALDLVGFAVSTGSACSSGTLEPSHVLRAMGLPSHRTQNSIRISLGPANTDADVVRFLDTIPAVVDRLRSLTRAPLRA